MLSTDARPPSSRTTSRVSVRTGPPRSPSIPATRTVRASLTGSPVPATVSRSTSLMRLSARAYSPPALSATITRTVALTAAIRRRARKERARS